MDRILVAKNKKAYHNFHIIDRYEAGLVLTGSEVKSLREGKISLREAYVLVRDSETVLIGAHISSYSSTGYKGHDPKANRKLLLKKKRNSSAETEYFPKRTYCSTIGSIF